MQGPSIKGTVGMDSTPMKKGLNDASSHVNQFKNRTEKSFAGMGDRLKGAFAGMGSGAAMGLAAVGTLVAGLAVKLVQLGKNVIGAADDLKDLSDALGLSTTAFQQFTQAFQQNGVSTEKFSKGYAKFLELLDDGRSGTESALATLAQLGLTLDDLNNPDTVQLFIKTADGIKGANNEAERLNLSLKAFGKSGKDMSILMSQGSEAVKAAMADATAASAASIEHLAEVQGKMDAFVDGVKAVAIEITSFIVTAFEALANQIKPFLDIINSLADVEVFGKSMKDVTGINAASAMWKGWTSRPSSKPDANQPPVTSDPTTPKQGSSSRSSGGGSAPRTQADADATAQEDQAERTQENQGKIADVFDQAAQDLSDYNQMPSQERGNLRRGRREDERSDNRAERNLGIPEGGITERRDKARKILEKQKSGALPKYSSEQQSLLEQLAKDGNVDAPYVPPDPIKDSDAGKGATDKNAADGTGPDNKGAGKSPDSQVLNDIKSELVTLNTKIANLESKIKVA